MELHQLELALAISILLQLPLISESAVKRFVALTVNFGMHN